MRFVALVGICMTAGPFVLGFYLGWTWVCGKAGWVLAEFLLGAS